jgi:Type I phosphodiesterase / nucleotide pyrophosphatase
MPPETEQRASARIEIHITCISMTGFFLRRSSSRFDKRLSRLVVAAALVCLCSSPALARNVIIFVADGLRHGSVNPEDAPTLYELRQQGTTFSNSHAVFPTFTTPNASAIATGHYLGDTGDFSNTLYPGFPIPTTFPGVQVPLTQTPFIENDAVLGCIDEHFGGNYLEEQTLLQYARQNGFLTAAIGKLGPTLIQDVTAAARQDGKVPIPRTVIIDDSTGKLGGIPLDPKIMLALKKAGLGLAAPDRNNNQPKTQQDNGNYGTNGEPGTLAPNFVQQQYFVDCLTNAVLPTFVQAQQPFVVVFWSRDPDGTQHFEGDSLNRLQPGINGPTSRNGVRNADNNLRQILEYLRAANLAQDTDIFVTSDHGFSTITKHELDASGQTSTKSFSTGRTYRDGTGRPEVQPGWIPPGFVAIDLANALQLKIYDPDRITVRDGKSAYKIVLTESETPDEGQEERPSIGDALIGGDGFITDQPDAKVIVAANGGSDLIYLPDHDSARLKQIVDFLVTQDYVSGLFVNSHYGEIPGTLTLADVNLEGATQMPTPDLVINFRSFSLNPKDPTMSAVTICDTTLQEGQGMHGSFNRADTFNNMAAYGPDFKKQFDDKAPVGNTDVALTVASILKLEIPHKGHLLGRVLREALADGPPNIKWSEAKKSSLPAKNGKQTTVLQQKVGDTLYFDAAGFQGWSVGLEAEGRENRR